MAGHEDPHLALLVYRATQLSHNLPSPAELLNLRKYHALLPTRGLAQSEKEERNREIMMQSMQLRKYNLKRTTQTELQGFKPNDPVYIQLNPHRSKWIKGTVIQLSYDTLQDAHTKYKQRLEEFTSETENSSSLEKTIAFRR